MNEIYERDVKPWAVKALALICERGRGREGSAEEALTHLQAVQGAASPAELERAIINFFVFSAEARFGIEYRGRGLEPHAASLFKLVKLLRNDVGPAGWQQFLQELPEEVDRSLRQG